MKSEGVRIIDDAKDSVTLIREIIDSNDQEDAFYVMDVGDIIKKHKTWLTKMPRVQPHFAVKCNPDPTVIRTLAALNASFDCASKREIEQVLSSGVPSERIIFANTVKPLSHIKFARKVGVNILTVDSESELLKIESIFPEAKIVIRFRCDAAMVLTTLGSKCGCDPINDAPKIMRKARLLGLKVHGFSFHVGSQCEETAAYVSGIKIALGLIEYAKSLGFEDVKLIDIGGGFPGERDRPIDEFAEVISNVVHRMDPSIKVISEPGRYYVASAFTLASLVQGKRTVDEGSTTRYMYYTNDGTYGSFVEAMLNVTIRIPRLLNKPANNEKHRSTFWGPTCDSFDCVVRDCEFPEVNVGDWLIWPDMGAYTVSLAGNFNGFYPSVVFPFIRRKEWNSFVEERPAQGIGFTNDMIEHN